MSAFDDFKEMGILRIQNFLGIHKVDLKDAKAAMFARQRGNMLVVGRTIDFVETLPRASSRDYGSGGFRIHYDHPWLGKGSVGVPQEDVSTEILDFLKDRGPDAKMRVEMKGDTVEPVRIEIEEAQRPGQFKTVYAVPELQS